MCAIIGFDSPTLTEQEIRPYFDRTISRGPDMSRMEKAGRGMLGFHRLAIMGLHEEGMQPFHLGGDMAVCNGELYGFRPLKKELEAKGYTFASESDCELILPLYREYGVEMFVKLDAEFAMIIYDAKADRLVAARDPIGIRPLFYGYLADGGILFASEAKNLVGLCERIMPFPPGHYYADGKFVRYADLTTVTEYSKDDLDTVCKKIREKLIAGVEKRLDADAPLGFLLSGGLDSSLVCAMLESAAADGHCMDIYLPESRFLNGGYPFVRACIENGHRVHFFPDVAIYHFMKQADLAMMGAETFFPNGDMVNTIGSELVALACKRYEKPLYIPTSLIKVDRRTMEGREKKQLYRDLKSILSQNWKDEYRDKADFICPNLDIVPPELITAYITEEGVVPCSALFGICNSYVERLSQKLSEKERSAEA